MCLVTRRSGYTAIVSKSSRTTRVLRSAFVILPLALGVSGGLVTAAQRPDSASAGIGYRKLPLLDGGEKAVIISEHRALRLYESMGFVKECHMRSKNGKYHDISEFHQNSF